RFASTGSFTQAGSSFRSNRSIRSTGDDVIGFIYSNDKRKQTRRLEKSLILESRQAIVRRSRDLIGSFPVPATFGLPVHVAAFPAAPFSTEHVLSGPKGSKCQEVDEGRGSSGK